MILLQRPGEGVTGIEQIKRHQIPFYRLEAFQRIELGPGGVQTSAELRPEAIAPCLFRSGGKSCAKPSELGIVRAKAQPRVDVLLGGVELARFEELAGQLGDAFIETRITQQSVLGDETAQFRQHVGNIPVPFHRHDGAELQQALIFLFQLRCQSVALAFESISHRQHRRGAGEQRVQLLKLRPGAGIIELAGVGMERVIDAHSEIFQDCLAHRRAAEEVLLPIRVQFRDQGKHQIE